MADDDKVFRLSGRVELEVKVESPPGESVGGKPAPPGTVVHPVGVTGAELQQLLIKSLGSLYVAADVSPPSQVIWYDHDSEVLVHLDRTAVKLGDGLVLVARLRRLGVPLPPTE